MTLFCIVNLEDIHDFAQAQGERLPLRPHRQWLERALVRHVATTGDAVHASAPSKAERAVPRVAQAIAGGARTARFVPSAALIRNTRLVNVWLVNAERPRSWLASTLGKVTFADAVVMATDWREHVLRFAERRRAMAPPADASGAPTVLDEPSLGEGWSWVWLRSSAAREMERKAMGHRLGRGNDEPLDPLMAILSLRDPGGMPCLTVQLLKTEVLRAVHKGNRDASPPYAAAATRVAEIIGPRLLVQWNPALPIADGRHRRGDLSVHVQGGRLHREDGPALEWAHGTREWYRRGRRHREGGPAVEHADGTKCWYLEGQLHRDDGPAVERADGTLEWRREGKLHREEGPALQHAGGRKCWYRNGQLHREDGPAIEWANGSRDWYLLGCKVSPDEVVAPSGAICAP